MHNHHAFNTWRAMACVCALACGVLPYLVAVFPARAAESPTTGSTGGSTGGSSIEPSVYRCTMPDGRIEFRQFPCHGRDESLLMEIDDRPSGWTPPDPAEVFKEERATTDRSSGTRGASSDARKAAAVDRRREEKCWKKEQQLEQVNRNLRAGYKIGEGQRLRHKRAEYQDYLRRFCD
ncbi:hypothetical protein Thiowin_03933 [Thiorhodovibrio winogradskyi]|uniref:DUF4124 domain-containing protein n=1 Tax=Thiorhodovibrio winogradskyi TaxID=77007 RepID=A0ABZ0SD69_9GAMM|nr:hypothetical protein [Thiorhodovibrio winogradskyi]